MEQVLSSDYAHQIYPVFCSVDDNFSERKMRRSIKSNQIQTTYMQFSGQWGPIMNTAIRRRISVSTCWASARIALLDSKESYEDSYAITQEFREWITCPGGHHDLLEASALVVPNLPSKSHSYDKTSDADEALEI